MINMVILNLFRNIGISIYLFIYLIFPYAAISEPLKGDYVEGLENALNKRNLKFIAKIFPNDQSQIIAKKFSQIIDEFPNSKWKIKRLKSNIPNKEILSIEVSGENIVNGYTNIFESNFDYSFSLIDGKIKKGNIKNLFTIIRNDDNKIDITFKIPDRVLTGSKYDIDIILTKPLEEEIIAGGIANHEINSFFKQEIPLEPLVSGGIFKMTRAPSKSGMQIWSGIIAHPEGMITFTKSIDILDKI